MSLQIMFNIFCGPRKFSRRPPARLATAASVHIYGAINTQICYIVLINDKNDATCRLIISRHTAGCREEYREFAVAISIHTRALTNTCTLHTIVATDRSACVDDGFDLSSRGLTFFIILSISVRLLFEQNPRVRPAFGY